ncbi:hypothetical protein ROA7450_02402 [Roseovarius albus]|uniref:Uncharacterized protein n=1 Tax=Roseovarius albus TaxID=1247867 RepID=A0A1X6ZE02_9RHOB|nr:hypothetical protein [Roseovarius albus]SLN48905.1 hypothetical protein ROA7450_02402 [Roseovarius albus]
MSLEKQFKLEAVEKPKVSNPIHQRRQKFIAAIDKQFANIPGGNSSMLSRSSNWVWQSDCPSPEFLEPMWA